MSRGSFCERPCADLATHRYPYKGVLDTLANRMFANGTNAWTDTTNTTYTVVRPVAWRRLEPVLTSEPRGPLEPRDF